MAPVNEGCSPLGVLLRQAREKRVGGTAPLNLTPARPVLSSARARLSRFVVQLGRRREAPPKSLRSPAPVTAALYTSRDTGLGTAQTDNRATDPDCKGFTHRRSRGWRRGSLPIRSLTTVVPVLWWLLFPPARRRHWAAPFGVTKFNKQKSDK